MHLPREGREEYFEGLARIAAKRPIRILMSACLTGARCGYDGSSYGVWDPIDRLRTLPQARLIPFCPEEFSFGTPRELCDIHGGNGFDVLEGRAQVLSASGKNWTEGMIRAAEKMVTHARSEEADLAILMDISAACGSQVIYDGDRTQSTKRYQRGPGVCAALLMKNGIPVLSQRDFKTLGRLIEALDPDFAPRSSASLESHHELKDHHESEWYQAHFASLTPAK